MKLRGISLMVLALVATMTAYAKLERHEFQVFVPGVAANGTPDFINTGNATVKYLLNTRNNRYLGTVRGQTPNASNRLQIFRNNPNINALLPPGINHSLFFVFRNGHVGGVFNGRQ